MKRSWSESLTERPVNIAQLVFDFREFVETTAQTLDRPVVIAIDELDKIADPTALQQLLRDVKGIFDIPGVYFFVSISDEALRSVQLGGVIGRDEFSSSFARVMKVEPFDEEAAQQLVTVRVPEIPPKATAMANALAGGNPRELLRLLDSVDRDDLAAFPKSILFVALTAEAEEVAASLDRLEVPVDARDGATETLWKHWMSPPNLGVTAFGYSVTNGYWEPTWSGPDWLGPAQDMWRRLLVRSWVVAELVHLYDQGSSDDLFSASDPAGEVIRSTEASALVGRRRFEQWQGIIGSGSLVS